MAKNKNRKHAPQTQQAANKANEAEAAVKAPAPEAEPAAAPAEETADLQAAPEVIEAPAEEKQAEMPEEMPRRAEPGKSLEEMTVEELQAEVLARLAANGPVTDRMMQDVRENVYRDSLLNWVKSFR